MTHEHKKQWLTLEEYLERERQELIEKGKIFGLDFEQEKSLWLNQEQRQKLAKQYANQEETPYIETSKPKVAFVDSKKDIEQVIFDMRKYVRLKEVIENMVARLDEGAELTLTKDSIIVLALKEALK